MNDVTEASGIHFVYDNGRAAGLYTIVESLGGGVGLFDYDNDGRHDVFFTGGGHFDSQKTPSGLTSALYRNLGGWRFAEVTQAAEVGRAPHYTHGCAAADFDNDGFTDLVVSGYGGLQLFHNLGDGAFEELSQSAGLTDRLWSTSLAWGDLDGDGCLDLYVVHYVDWSPDHHPRCPGEGSVSSIRAKLASARPEFREVCSPRSFSPVPDAVYFSNGDGTFRDATSEARLRTEQTDCGRGLGVVMGDLDLDDDLDIYVTNDTDANFLYLNQGRGEFEEVGSLHGVAGGAGGNAEGSMGADLADYNQDGLPDLWSVNFEKEFYSLYRNDGDARFTHVSRMSGIANLRPQFVGFGTAFADLDADGDEDLVVSNGHVFYHSQMRQQAVAMVNESGRFRLAAFPQHGYFSEPHCGRGLAVSDLDNDGDLDVVLVHNDGERNAVLANESPSGNWLRVRLVGKTVNRDAIGARLILYCSAGNQFRQIKGGGSYLSQSDLRPFWGLPPQTEIKRLSIKWPGGAQQDFPLFRVNQTLIVAEGAVEPIEAQ